MEIDLIILDTCKEVSEQASKEEIISEEREVAKEIIIEERIGIKEVGLVCLYFQVVLHLNISQSVKYVLILDTQPMTAKIGLIEILFHHK